MYDDDLDALAAEYVLGTLSADERGHAEALLVIDPGFDAAVRQWERRLGELNVMVEAVEPPPEVWDSIRSGWGTKAPGTSKPNSRCRASRTLRRTCRTICTSQNWNAGRRSRARAADSAGRVRPVGA